MGADGYDTRGSEPQENELRFAVLGPVCAYRGDREIPMGSPQQRALLASLLLRGGRTASIEELIDGQWGDRSPDKAKQTLRTYASRIRKALGADAGLLVSESSGYAIRPSRATSRTTVDLETAEAHAAEAEKAASSGDRSAARDGYAAALAQFSGEPLSGLAGPHVEQERNRLATWRSSLLEHRLDLDLQLGNHTEAVSELTALTAADPLQERLRELLMLALYRSGRQGEALAVYTDTRELLAESLGVDPRPELTRLHQRILEADPDLSLTPDEPSGPATPRTAQPAQLPATVADFTGRQSFVAELGEQLAQAGGKVMAVSAVAGIGGVGKTTLAVHVAHAAAEHFPDGQLYVDLQGAGPAALEPEAVLGSFLRSLGVEDSSLPEGVEDRSALYRSLLSGRRVLALLDNARDAAQVRPLLPGTSGCAAVVTSRARMVDLAGAQLVDLDVMSPDEAMTLFTRIVGRERVGAERQAALDVVGACGFLPLAIRIAASRLASRRTWTVATLAAKLADERRRLDELRLGDQGVKASFELGYGQLDPGQARAFRLLGLVEGPDISVQAAAALLDKDGDTAEDLLESLVDASLVESAAPERYRFHDLVRLFARDCAERDEQPAARQEAFARLLDFYLATASKVFALERPGERTRDHLVRTGTAGAQFADRDTALGWMFAEADCLLACVEQAAGHGLLRHAADLLIAVKDFADSGVHSIRYERAGETVRDAARAAGDPFAEARAQIMLTHVHIVAGRFDQADREAARAGALAEESGDVLAANYSLNDRGIVANCQKRYEDAETHLLRAIEAFRADDNSPSEASALCNLAHANSALGRTDRAVELAREGLAIYQRLNHRMRAANAKYALGRALTQTGRIAEGLDELDGAAALFRETRQQLWEGSTHFRMAEAHLAARRPDQAAGHAERALALRGVGGEWMRGRMLTVLGQALAALGQRDRAHVCWKDALAVFDGTSESDAAEVRTLLTHAQAA